MDSKRDQKEKCIHSFIHSFIISLTVDEWCNDEFDEPHLHIAENDGVAVAHGRHLEALALLPVSLHGKLFHHEQTPLVADGIWFVGIANICAMQHQFHHEEPIAVFFHAHNRVFFSSAEALRVFTIDFQENLLLTIINIEQKQK